MKLTPCNTYKVATCLIVISILACTMGFASIIVAFQIKSCYFDPTSTALAIMAIFVTFLVGWNIYTLIDLRDFKDKEIEIEKRINQTRKYLEISISNNINNAIDMLVELGTTKSLQDQFVVYITYFYISEGYKSESVKISLLRIISNTIKTIIAGGVEYSNGFIEEVSRRLVIRQVKCFADAYSKSHKEYDSVLLWINRLEEEINKRKK